uniref:8.9 kDa family member n=1 Tax=Rhipicephalus zambeziensis TaxID=60191 RepID=A0A224YC61_9ACAR
MNPSALSREPEGNEARGSEIRKRWMLVVMLAVIISANVSVGARAPIADFSPECNVCKYDGNFMFEGDVLNLSEPCAQVACSASCSSVTVVGCPAPEGAQGGSKTENEWPHCCSGVKSRIECNTRGY